MSRSTLNFPKAFQHYKPRSQKVYGVICITNESRILLVRGRDTGIWSFPKGHITGNELPKDCALRELREETGIQLSDLNCIGSKKLYAGEYFIYEIQNEIDIHIQDKKEISEAGWFTMEEFRRFHCNVDIMNFITKINRGLLNVMAIG